LITIGPDGESEDELPARVTVVGEFPAVLVTVSISVVVPDTVGVKVTCRLRL
jgi:hypothetical protein